MTFGYQKSMKKAINQLPEQMTFKQQQKTFFNLQLKLFRHTYIENADLEQVKKLHKQSEDFSKQFHTQIKILDTADRNAVCYAGNEH